MSITIQNLITYKTQRKKFACLTAYDASFSALLNQAGIEVLLIGDSLGQVIQGQKNTLPVRVEDVAYHIECVARAQTNALLIGDLPFMSYATREDAAKNAATLIRAGAHMIKMEGGDWLLDTVRFLTERGISVCAHLGLTPQHVHVLGGYSAQGRNEADAKKIFHAAVAMEQAGAQMLVLECVPEVLAGKITEKLRIPTVGIGAGRFCDAQILVLYDMLGITMGAMPRFVKNFLEDSTSILGALQKYKEAVESGTFPEERHTYA